MSRSEENDHSLGGDMAPKSRWSALKRMTAVASPVLRADQTGIHGANDEGEHSHDSGMWDNNDDSFLREVALERQHFHRSPSHSDHAMERIASLPGSSQSGQLPHSVAPSWSRPLRPTSAGGSLLTYGSLSTSASDVSSALTYPSPGSSKVELSSRQRLSGQRFSGSHEASPTSTSFSSGREAKQRSHSPDKLHEGWTEEVVVMPIGRNDEHAGFLGSDVLLTSLPEEQNHEQFDSHGSRRPSTTSSHRGSPLTPSRKTLQSQGARRVESSPTTDYGREKTPVHAAKSPLLSSPKGSPTPTKKSGGLVSGLKKKLGGTLRSTGAPKQTAGKLPPSNSWAGSPTPATDEVQIVSADSMSKLDSPSLGAVAARATLSSQSSKGPPPFAHEFGAAEADMSVDGKWLARTASKDRMNGSTDSLSSRLFNKKRSSGLFSHSRNSSRTSIIEHTSFDEVRRQSGVYSGAASLSSQQNLHMPSLARTSVFGGSEEEREELQGDYSPLNGSYDLPHQARPLRSPIRPERMLDDSSTSLPVGIHANRASLESSFNAAHDKRWSTVGPSFRSERRGSESGLPRASFTMRRGSDVGTAGYGSSSRGVDHHKHDSVSSIHSKRSSLLQNLSEDALVPSKPAKGNRRSLAGQTSQRWSDMILAPRPRKLSASSVQISRPTSIVGGPSASMADEISAQDEYKHATSSTELVAQRLRKKQEQLGRKPIPPPIYAMQQLSSPPPPFNVRQSRSAGGRVEYPSAAGSPFTHIGHGNETEPSTFLVQQQSAPKRPTFGLDMPPDAAAAFDCIPSPQARRIRTSSTPALLGLSISGVEGASAVGINGHAVSSRRTGGWKETHDDEGEEQEELLLPEEADLEALDGTIHLPYSSDTPSPRPLPSDTPQSPQMDEVELLADEGSPDGADGNGGRAPPIRNSPSLPPHQSDLPRKHSQDSLSCSSQQQARRVSRPSYSFV